jgi:ATP-dependent exoDNAse (exonuclease V) beta subunit
VAHLLASLAIGRKPYIVGGVQELRWLLNDVALLKRDQAATHPEFFGFNSWHQVQQFTERLEGEHLLKLTKLVEVHGEASILKALENTAEDENQADLILSTAHKSKGREWENVMLDDDFFAPKLATEVKPNASSEATKNTSNKDIEIMGPNGQNYFMAAEEIRLLYVAATRAKKALQIPEWSARFFELHQDSFSPAALLQAQPVMNKQAKSALEQNRQNRQNAEAKNTSAVISKPSPINSSSRDAFKINDKQNVDSYSLQSPNSSKRYCEKMINAQLLFWASPIGATVMGFMSLLLFAVLFHWFNRY